MTAALTWLVLINTIAPVSAIYNILRTIVITLVTNLFGYKNRKLYMEECNYSTSRIWLRNMRQNMLFSQTTDIIGSEEFPSGFVVGKWGCFIAHVCFQDNKYGNLLLWAKPQIWKKIDFELNNPDRLPSSILEQSDEDSENESSENFEIVDSDILKEFRNYQKITKQGNFKSSPWISQNKMMKALRYSDPRTENQIEKIDEIHKIFLKNKEKNEWNYGSCTIVLSGPSDCGKTSLTKMLACKLDFMWCNSYKPMTPGHSYTLLLSAFMPTDKGIVIVIEEFDSIIESIENPSNIIPDKDYNLDIVDKSSLNNVLDDLAETQNVILILTTNRKPEWFDSRDKSILGNSGRIDAVFNLWEKKDK